MNMEGEMGRRAFLRRAAWPGAALLAGGDCCGGPAPN